MLLVASLDFSVAWRSSGQSLKGFTRFIWNLTNHALTTFSIIFFLKNTNLVRSNQSDWFFYAWNTSRLFLQKLTLFILKHLALTKSNGNVKSVCSKMMINEKWKRRGRNSRYEFLQLFQLRACHGKKKPHNWILFWVRKPN